MSDAPDWWNWDIELNSHVLKRMADRNFNETELRLMLEDATQWIEQSHGKWIVSCRLNSAAWEAIVRPDKAECCIVVATFYAVS
jgi:hypothetical protein